MWKERSAFFVLRRATFCLGMTNHEIPAARGRTARRTMLCWIDTIQTVRRLSAIRGSVLPSSSMWKRDTVEGDLVCLGMSYLSASLSNTFLVRHSRRKILRCAKPSLRMTVFWGGSLGMTNQKDTGRVALAGRVWRPTTAIELLKQGSAIRKSGFRITRFRRLQRVSGMTKLGNHPYQM